MIPSRIVIHHSATKDNQTFSWNAIRKFHINERKWTNIGYHFGIELFDDTYEILTGRFMDKQGAHAKDANAGSIGICLVGNFNEEKPSAELIEISSDFVASLCHVLHIHSDRIFAHYEVSGSGYTCPGREFNIDAFRSHVRQNLVKRL